VKRSEAIEYLALVLSIIAIVLIFALSSWLSSSYGDIRDHISLPQAEVEQ